MASRDRFGCGSLLSNASLDYWAAFVAGVIVGRFGFQNDAAKGSRRVTKQATIDNGRDCLSDKLLVQKEVLVHFLQG